MQWAQWLQRHPEAGSSWPSWPKASYTDLLVDDALGLGIVVGVEQRVLLDRERDRLREQRRHRHALPFVEPFKEEEEPSIEGKSRLLINGAVYSGDEPFILLDRQRDRIREQRRHWHPLSLVQGKSRLRRRKSRLLRERAVH